MKGINAKLDLGGNGGGGAAAQLAVSITYAALKALRDGGNLVPGTWYRITDYVCTTTQDNTQSAEHAFDVIVRADDTSHLNENAFAAHHEGDEYFADCKLEAWELKYCIDNDTDRFAWALRDNYLPSDISKLKVLYETLPNDLKNLMETEGIDYNDDDCGFYLLEDEENQNVYGFSHNDGASLNGDFTICLEKERNYNIGDTVEVNGTTETTITSINGQAYGKGVVFFMKDEWNNECPYDFKNIMFKRWAVTEYEKCPSLVVDSQDNNYGYYYGAIQLNGESQVLENATYGEDFGWFYTFALKDLASDEWYDYTVVAHLGLKNDEGGEVACYDNHIVEGTDEYSSGKGEMAKMLNNIVFFNCYGDLSDTSYSDDYSYCNNNRFLGNCQSNTFGNYCQNNSFGNSCNGNTFGNNFQYTSFGNGCNNNSFGNNCYSNSFGNDCYRNSFGNYCYSNSFGNSFYWNSFGNDCNYNSFGNGFQKNSFGNGCNNNSFGNDCRQNSFGNECYQNSFGNDCNYNSFGNNCYSNSFGNNCGGNTFGNYCQTITVFDGVQNCSVTGGSQSAPVKNAQILNGTAGASAQNKLTIAFAANKAYTQVAAKNTAGNLKIWNPADLAE